MSIVAIIVVVSFLLLGIGLVAWFVMLYNGLVTVKNNVDKSWSNIDVLLKQRHDELPKLVKVCENYIKHESDTLERVILARSMMTGARNMQEHAVAEGVMEKAIKSLFAVSEQYPDLKADRQFRQLQARVSTLENEIADRRELFNESVNIFNIRIEKIPDVFVASLLKYNRRELWQIHPEDRRDIELKFSTT